jgi:hypothetical protein
MHLDLHFLKPFDFDSISTTSVLHFAQDNFTFVCVSVPAFNNLNSFTPTKPELSYDNSLSIGVIQPTLHRLMILKVTKFEYGDPFLTSTESPKPLHVNCFDTTTKVKYHDNNYY